MLFAYDRTNPEAGLEISLDDTDRKRLHKQQYCYEEGGLVQGAMLWLFRIHGEAMDFGPHAEVYPDGRLDVYMFHDLPNLTRIGRGNIQTYEDGDPGLVTAFFGRSGEIVVNNVVPAPSLVL
jgi:hypothetical protein